MHITLIPQRSDNSLSVVRQGDALTINGEVFDFSSIPEGGSVLDKLIPCNLFVSPAQRVEGRIHLTLILPHGPDPESWQKSPAPIIDPPDGEVDLPWDTYQTEKTEKVEGGTRIVVTTYRWHQEPEVNTTFEPDAPQDAGDENVEA